MEFAGLGIVDIAVLIIIVLSSLVGVLRGIVKETLSLLSWAIAGFITWHFTADVNEYVSQSISSKPISFAVSAIGLFFTVLIICAIINSFIAKLIHMGGLNGIDRSAGLLYGILRGAFIVSLCFLALTMVISGSVDAFDIEAIDEPEKTIFDTAKYPEWLEKAHSFNGLKAGAEILYGLFGDFLSPEEAQKISDSIGSE